MDKKTGVSGFRRYGLVGFLIVALASVYYVDHHPEISRRVAPAFVLLGSVATIATPGPEFVNGTAIVPGDITAYHVDVAVDAVGTRTVATGLFPVVKISAGQPLTLAGWAVDTQESGAAGGVAGILDDKIKVAGMYGGIRPDVAKVLGNGSYERSAFSIAIPAEYLTQGKHSFKLLILSKDRSKFYEPTEMITIMVGS
jgi:hypothetical protein